MPPFLELRMWLREGPVAERVLAGIAALIVVVLGAVALVPVERDDQDDLAAVGVADGGTAVTGAPAGGATGSGVAPAPTTGDDGGPGGSPAAPGGAAPVAGGSTGRTTSRAGTGPGGAATASQASCAGRGSSAPGVTATELRVAVSLISLAGPIGNSTFDIRPDLDDITAALTAEVNRTGGIACGRKLVTKTYDVNPLDSNDAQAKCLQMVEDRPYIVLDFGGYLSASSRACFVRAKLPMVSSVAFDSVEAKDAHPYVLGPRNLTEDQVRNGVLGLADRGFFSAPGFKKLGVFADNCRPSVNRELEASLARAGVKPDQVSTFVVDCSPAAAANQIAQAVLQHKSAGASHVFLATAANNGQNYVRVATSQNFRPVWGISDLGEGLTPSGAANWGASFAGALGITSTHVGETNSGPPNAKVVACDRAMERHGVRGFSSEAEDNSLVGMCDLFDFVRRATDRAGTNPAREDFARGITAIGRFETAMLGDGLFDRPGKVAGDDFQRAVRFDAGCGCWKVVDAFGPAYRRA